MATTCNFPHIQQSGSKLAGAPFYIDGSCYPHICCDLSRAAWAVVQMDEHGQVGLALHGAVTASQPQTAQSAELSAAAAAAAVVTQGDQVISDCQGVINACRRGAGRHLELHLHGGTVMQAFNHKDARSSLQCM